MSAFRAATARVSSPAFQSTAVLDPAGDSSEYSKAPYSDCQAQPPTVTLSVSVLASMARRANSRAKELKGRDRAIMYGFKTEILSLLLTSNNAVASGLSPDRIVGVKILIDPPDRLHVPMSQLPRDAQAVVNRQLEGAPVVARLSDGMTPDHVEFLRCSFPPRREVRR